MMTISGNSQLRTPTESSWWTSSRLRPSSAREARTAVRRTSQVPGQPSTIRPLRLSWRTARDSSPTSSTLWSQPSLKTQLKMELRNLFHSKLVTITNSTLTVIKLWSVLSKACQRLLESNTLWPLMRFSASGLSKKLTTTWKRLFL